MFISRKSQETVVVREVINQIDRWLVLTGSTLCQIMEHIWPKMGNPLVIFFIICVFKLIIRVPNVKNTLIMTQYKFNCMQNKKEWL